MDPKLGCLKREASNRHINNIWNGYTSMTVRSESGLIELDIPRESYSAVNWAWCKSCDWGWWSQHSKTGGILHENRI
jgi:hypothetical protein